MLGAFGLLILGIVLAIYMLDNYKPIYKCHKLVGVKLDHFLNDYGIFRRHKEPDVLYRERAACFFENDEVVDEEI